MLGHGEDLKSREFEWAWREKLGSKVTEQQRQAFERRLELEADELGLTLIARCGMDVFQIPRIVQAAPHPPALSIDTASLIRVSRLRALISLPQIRQAIEHALNK